MADLKNVQPLNDFDWDAFEKGTFNEDKIEVISEYKQGVAIVKKNNLFGAIMVGGKEIIKPIYEKLSDFDCGYAKASYTIHINGVEKQEERSINMSGQICVMHNENEVYLLKNMIGVWISMVIFALLLKMAYMGLLIPILTLY